MTTTRPPPTSRGRVLRSPLWSRSPLLSGLACGVAIFSILWTRVEGQPTPQPSDQNENRHYDARIEATKDFSVLPLATQAQSVSALTSLVPDLMVTYDEKFGVTRSLLNAMGYLTPEEPGREAFDIGLAFVQANLELLGLLPEDLAGYTVAKHFTNPVTGATRMYLRQTYQGLEVYNAELQVNVNRAGRILSVNNQFVPRLSASINAVGPVISAAEAVAVAATHAKLPLNGLPRMLSISSGLASPSTSAFAARRVSEELEIPVLRSRVSRRPTRSSETQEGISSEDE